MRRDIPGVSRWVAIRPRSSSSSRSMTPWTTSRVSSFTRWYCRLSISPVLMWITLPRYLSVMAKRFSQPQGFLTTPPPCPPPEGEGGALDKLARSQTFFERGQQLVDALHGAGLAIDPDQRLAAG